MSDQTFGGPEQLRVVVGVTLQQPENVVRQAARFARLLQAVLVCAHVDRDSYVVAEHPDGSISSRPIDPDRVDWEQPDFDEELAARIRRLTEREQVQVELRELAGDPAVALSRLADVLQAELLVVGARRSRLRSTLSEYFGGSVAAQMAHRQHRPVVLIPRPAGQHVTPPPWQRTGS